jgi:hypothetical protein
MAATQAVPISHFRQYDQAIDIESADANDEHGMLTTDKKPGADGTDSTSIPLKLSHRYRNDVCTMLLTNDFD